MSANSVNNKKIVVGPAKAAPQAPAQQPAKKAVSPQRPLVGAANLDTIAFNAPTRGNKVTFHVTPTESKQAILDAIKHAKNSFYIETFIWHNDEAGREIADALGAKIKEAKARGESFDVKVMIDWLGLRNSTGAAKDTEIVDRLRAHGAEVHEFAPGYIDWENQKISPITHRKLYIADGEKFITGGRNIGNEYLNPEYEVSEGVQEASWHDLLYTVEGAETGRILTEFFKNWERVGGKRPAVMPAVVPAKGGSASVQTVVTDPLDGTRGIREAHTRLIAGAKKEIVAIFPYFSDDQFVEQLIAAKQANPKLSVKVMLPANKEASREGSIYSLLNRESARQLVAAGVEVRMFDGGEVQRFSHMKGMVVDGQILSIGSANADARTYHDNHELNTLIVDEKTAQDYLAKIVKPDWAAAKPVTLAELGQDSWWARLKQRVLEVFDFLL